MLSKSFSDWVIKNKVVLILPEFNLLEHYLKSLFTIYRKATLFSRDLEINFNVPLTLISYFMFGSLNSNKWDVISIICFIYLLNISGLPL